MPLNKLSRRALTVGSAVFLATGVLGGTAAHAGADGVHAPYAQAAAVVNADGTVVRSQGVAEVTKPGVGTYCVRLDGEKDVNTLVPTATLSGRAEWGAQVYVETTPVANCGNASDVVGVLTGTANGSSDQPFTIVLS